MNISMLTVAVAATACLCIAAAAPDGRMGRTKQQRPTRGFKNVEMMTARGFGKRDRPHTRAEHENNYSYDIRPRKKFNPKNSLMTAYDFGKRSGNDDINDEEYGMDNFWEMMEGAPEREGLENGEDKTLESIPLDWFVNEMLNNPDFARSVVRKFIDLNQDGMLSADELLRNVV